MKSYSEEQRAREKVSLVGRLRSCCVRDPGFQAALFRRTYRELNDTHMKGPGSFPAILAGAQNEGICRIVKDEIRFANGSRISLNHCQYEHNVTSYQGAEFHLLQIDELTHWTSYMYTYLRTRCRLGNLVIPPKYVGKLPLIVSTSNPGGIGHNWVKDFFEPDKPYVIRHMTGKGDGGMYRQFIPATIADNPDTLKNDPSYVDKLEGVGDPQTARALLRATGTLSQTLCSGPAGGKDCMSLIHSRFLKAGIYGGVQMTALRGRPASCGSRGTRSKTASTRSGKFTETGCCQKRWDAKRLKAMGPSQSEKLTAPSPTTRMN